MFDQLSSYSTSFVDVPGGLSSWNPGERAPDFLYRRMAGHAAFADAVRALAAGYLEMSASDRAIDGIFKDAGRYIAAASAAAMSWGVTLAGVKRLCAKFGMLSPGRAAAMLLYLRYLGYISAWPDRPASGAARYCLSPTFKAAWQEHLCVALHSASLIEPAAYQVAARLNEPAFFNCFCRVQLDCLAESMPYWDHNMAFARVFLNRHAGTQIGWTLLVQNGEGTFPFSGPLEICKVALARRFGVSLMHVKRLFAEARREGLIWQDDEHQLFLTELARDQIRYLYAGQLVQLLMASARTLVAMAPPSEPH